MSGKECFLTSALSHCSAPHLSSSPVSAPSAQSAVWIQVSPRLLACNGGAVCAEFGRAKEHVMRPAQLQLGEIESERRLQLFAVPGISAEELFVVVALLVPLRQKRAGEIEPFPVPALRHHIHLLADLFFVNLF